MLITLPCWLQSTHQHLRAHCEQYDPPVGGGPSSKTWPMWPLQVLQTTCSDQSCSQLRSDTTASRSRTRTLTCSGLLVKTLQLLQQLAGCDQHRWRLQAWFCSWIVQQGSRLSP